MSVEAESGGTAEPKRSRAAVSPLNASIGAVIGAARRARKESETALGKRIGVSRWTIQELERGSAATAFDTIVKACLALGLDPSEVVKTTYAQQLREEKL